MTSETKSAVSKNGSPLRALCVARHCFLSEHIARYFAHMGIETTNVVGLDSAVQAAGEMSPDVVICDTMCWRRFLSTNGRTTRCSLQRRSSR